MAVGECTVTTVSEEGSELLDRSTTKATHLKVQYSSAMVCNFGLLSILPFDEDEDSGSDEEGDSDESEGEFGASKTRSGKGYQNDDDDDDDPYIPQPLSKAPPWQRSDKHPSKVIDVEEADDAPKEGIQLERWGELPEIQESEGDDQSIDSLEVSEPDIDVPEAPTPQPAPSPAPVASRPTRDWQDLEGKLALSRRLDGAERFGDGLRVVGRISAVGCVATMCVDIDVVVVGLPEVTGQALVAAEVPCAANSCHWCSSSTPRGRCGSMPAGYQGQLGSSLGGTGLLHKVSVKAQVVERIRRIDREGVSNVDVFWQDRRPRESENVRPDSQGQ